MFDTLNGIIGNVSPSQDGALDRFGSIGRVSIITINSIIGIGFAISVLTIAYSSIKYILVADNPDNAKEAWRTFLYGVIAAAISLGAFALKNVVVNAIGVTDPNIIGTPDL
jgi:hypothetical protein